VLAVAVDHAGGGRRVLASVKQNLARDPAALSYALDDGRLTWQDAVPGLDIDTLLGQADPHSRAEQTDAEHVILELLDDTGWPMDAKQALAAGAAHGVHERTLQRAAKRMGIRISRVGFGHGGRWVWHRPIPDSVADNAPGDEKLSPMSDMTKQAAIGDNNNIDDTHTLPARAREELSDHADDRTRY
jgi:hypothetical protein